jgi:nitrite reductase/ring-hydroxylating ferredoxin subunit
MTETNELQTLNLIELCATADVAEGGATKVEKEGLTLAVFNLDNQFYVTDDLCTHGPGSLSEGCIEGDTVICDFHEGAFNIRTGEVVTPPCMIPLRTYKVHTENGKVFIDPNQQAFSLSPAPLCPKVA